MSDQLIDAFDDCITDLMKGVSLNDCLARYPAMAEDLRPLLLTTIGVQKYMSPVTVPPQALAASRAKLLAGAIRENKSERHERIRIFNPLALLKWRTALVLACIFIGFILGTYEVVHASARSLPGDLLYGVKRTTEKARLLFSTSPEKHALIEDQISQRRAQEAHEITKLSRTTSIEFGGRLESMKRDLGIVAGVPVIILPDTQITGIPEIGLYVWVTGTSQSNQTIKASTIRVEGIRFRGEVISMLKPGWKVDKSNIIISKLTHIIGNPGVGDQVDVNVRILSDGQLLAEEITLISKGKKPTDTHPQAPAITATVTPVSPRSTHTPNNHNTDLPEETDIPKPSKTPTLLHDKPTPKPSEEDKEEEEDKDDEGNGDAHDDSDETGTETPKPTGESSPGHTHMPSSTEEHLSQDVKFKGNGHFHQQQNQPRR